MSRKKVTKRLLTQNIHRQCPHVGYSLHNNNNPPPQITHNHKIGSVDILDYKTIKDVLLEICNKLPSSTIDRVLYGSKSSTNKQPPPPTKSIKTTLAAAAATTPYIAPQIVRDLLIVGPGGGFFC